MNNYLDMYVIGLTMLLNPLRIFFRQISILIKSIQKKMNNFKSFSQNLKNKLSAKKKYL